MDRTLLRAAELGEVAWMRAAFEYAGPQVRDNLGLASTAVGSGVVTVCAKGQGGMFFSRCIGLGIDAPVTAGDIEAAQAFCRDNRGPGLVFQIAPAAEPTDWADLLSEAGAQPSRNWVKFAAECTPRPEPATGLRLEVLGAPWAADAGRIMAEGFELPLDSGYPGWFADALDSGRDDMRVYGAFDGEELISVAMLCVWGEIAALAGAATVSAARGRGAQGALMARRINDAAAAGCRWVSAETGAETEDEPNPSLHNMRRAGLTELYERTNWVWLNDG